jgi:transposase
MRLDLANLPSDVALLQALVRDMAGVVERGEAELQRRGGEIERLQAIVKQLQRMQYGRRSERLDPDQLALGLEDLDSDLARLAEDRPVTIENTTAPPPARRALPEHLPRDEERLDVEPACPCCGGAMHPAGEHVSEMLDWAPAELRVKRIVRPKYACRACNRIVQAPAPERPIAGGLATPGLIAQVLVAKYCDHLPLYRQAKIFARHGAEIPRSTLSGWVGGAAWWLEALHEKIARDVFGSDVLFADDTPVPVLDPGRGRTKTGRLWVYAREQRGWAGSAPPAAVYIYEGDRKAARPAAHLSGFKGILHVDGYKGFERLTASGDVTLAACWAHMRRKFYDVAQATNAPAAHEALARIAAIYAVETEARGQPPPARLALRRERARPLVEALRRWLEGELARTPGRSGLAEAIRYALSRWDGLSVFLKDGRVELDTNPVERAIRPVALGRKNHLFAGSDGGADRWAIVATLIETARLNGVEPYAYLKDVLTKMTDGHPVNRLDELLPWAWKAGADVKALEAV